MELPGGYPDKRLPRGYLGVIDRKYELSGKYPRGHSLELSLKALGSGALEFNPRAGV